MFLCLAFVKNLLLLPPSRRVAAYVFVLDTPLDDAPASLPAGAAQATLADSVDSASDSIHPYSSRSGRHANLC